MRFEISYPYFRTNGIPAAGHKKYLSPTDEEYYKFINGHPPSLDATCRQNTNSDLSSNNDSDWPF